MGENISEVNYAACLKLAEHLARQHEPNMPALAIENEWYWSVREAILPACRQRGLRFTEVISTYCKMSWLCEDEEIRELARPVWPEVGMMFIIHDIHDV